MAVYLTGDTHISLDIGKLDVKNFPEQKSLTRDDYVVVLGDFGLYWHEDEEYRHWRKWLTERNFTLLWLDGNHENHAWIDTMPVTAWHGGRVQQSEDNIIHLMRGEIYEICDHSFFVLGGAYSTDKEHRIVDVSWWAREEVSYAEQENALDNLEAHGFKVDYVLTHTCPAGIIEPMFNMVPYRTTTDNFLDEVRRVTEYKEWYFGHFHEDKDYLNFHCLYDDVIRLI